MDTYTIYQVKENAENRDIIFEGYDYIKKKGIVPNVSYYDEVYTGELREFQSSDNDIILEDIFEKFNLEHPKDYKGRSLSVSDVVVIRKGDAENGENVSIHYVDRFGFQNLEENFLEIKEPDKAIDQTLKLAMDIDRFISELDPYDYNDSLTDSRESNIESLRNDIETGNVEYIQSGLNDVLSDVILSDHEESEVRNLIKQLNEISNTMELSEESKERLVYLTGQPISEKMKYYLSELEKGIEIPVDDICSTVEIQTAYTCVSHSIPTEMIAGREDIRNNIFNKMVELGSANVDESGEIQYNGEVRKDKRLDIVIGLPGSGKNSALVDVISAETKSLVIDNDNIKKLIPEFNNGWGGNTVHGESKLIEKRVLINCLRTGKNVVIPKVGGNIKELIDDYVIPATVAGYSINAHYVELSKAKAMARALNRFIDTGKYQDPHIYEKYISNEKNGVEETYSNLKNSELLNGYSHWDNDVKFGERPVLIESDGLTDRFITEARINIDKVESVDKQREGESYGTVSNKEPSAGVIHADAQRDSEHVYQLGDNGLLRRVINESIQDSEQKYVGDTRNERRRVQSVSSENLESGREGTSPGKRPSLLNNLGNCVNQSNINSSSRKDIDLSKFREELS